jgi:hypothetical protein
VNQVTGLVVILGGIALMAIGAEIMSWAIDWAEIRRGKLRAGEQKGTE